MPLHDVGRFGGRYFQVLAWVSITWMVVSLIFFDRLHIDFSFILLFWAASHLTRHNPTARKWTIGLTGFCVGLMALLLLYAAIAGTDGMTVTLGRRIENPSFLHVAVVGAISLALLGIPLGLLLTPKARREFGQTMDV